MNGEQQPVEQNTAQQIKKERKIKKLEAKFKNGGGKFFGDFKKFAFKGNIIDLAIAVIIGAAFGKIITSLVNDIVMPGLGVIIGGVEFSQFKIVLKKAIYGFDADGNWVETKPESAIRYGQFIQTVIEFFIIALSIFIIYKIIMRLRKKVERKKGALPPPPLSKTDQLLTEIKDLLQAQNETKKDA